MVQIDWLSINYSAIYNRSKLFQEKHLPYGTRIFKNVTELYQKSTLVATIMYNPLSSVIRKDLVQMKIANKWLYHPGLYDMIKMIESDLMLTFIGFSRIDICHDFNTFAKNVHPEKFIQRVASGHYLKKGQANFKFIANNQDKIHWEYFKIGSNSSNIVAYLYNKTKELDQVHNKPYIRETWSLNGIDQSKDVWRLEISIKGDCWKLINKETGEDYRHSSEILKNNDTLTALYIFVLDKFFTFYHNDGQKRKDRNRRVELFYGFNNTHILEHWSEFEDSTRSDKIFINKLLRCYDEYREHEQEKAETFYTMADNFSKMKALVPYMTKKKLEIGINN